MECSFDRIMPTISITWVPMANLFLICFSICLTSSTSCSGVKPSAPERCLSIIACKYLNYNNLHLYYSHGPHKSVKFIKLIISREPKKFFPLSSCQCLDLQTVFRLNSGLYQAQDFCMGMTKPALTPWPFNLVGTCPCWSIKIVIYLRGCLTWQHPELTPGRASGLLQHALQ